MLNAHIFISNFGEGGRRPSSNDETPVPEYITHLPTPPTALEPSKGLARVDTLYISANSF